MNKKSLVILGIVWTVVQTIISCGIFVTFPQMIAYAASKADLTGIHTQLQRIETKLDKIIMGY